jgi:hypothetical protein
MSRGLENYPLPIVCTHCGAQIQKSVQWFTENSVLHCPCGTTLYLETSELILAVEALESALARVIRANHNLEGSYRSMSCQWTVSDALAGGRECDHHVDDAFVGRRVRGKG